MSDADYHEGYFEGVRICSQYLLTLLMTYQGEEPMGPYQDWLSSELADAKIIRDEFKRDEE